MPRKYAKQKDTPELFAKVFKVINGLKNKRTYITVNRISKEIHAKLEQMGLHPNSRNVLVQVRRALKFGVDQKLFLQKAGKYRLAMLDGSTKSSRKEVVPMDSLELLKARKSRQRSKNNSNVKKRRCTHQEHTCSCRKRHKKHSNKPNKRYLSRKCKSHYPIRTSNEKSSKSRISSNRTSQQLGETTNAENTKSGSTEKQEITVSSPPDIHHWNNKQEAIDKSKYGKQSKRSRFLGSYSGTATNSEEPKSRKIKKRRTKTKEIENLSNDNALSGLSTSTAIAAAIMIMMSLWYGYR